MIQALLVDAVGFLFSIPKTIRLNLHFVKFFCFFDRSKKMSTDFYKEFERLRLPDPASKSGYESDRQMAKRLGIHNKTITLYKRGATPHPQTISEMVNRGGYNQETFYRLLSAAAGKTKSLSDKMVPVYRPINISSEGVSESTDPIMEVTCPPEIATKVNKQNLIGIKLDENDTSCEPRISRGSIVVYSSEPCDEPVDGGLYVVHDEAGTRVCGVRIRGKEMWMSVESLNDLVKVTKRHFQEYALGEVIFSTKYFLT
jgi:hypothetical protein